MSIDIREFSEPFFPAIGRAIIAWARLEIRADEQLIAMLSHKSSYDTRQMLKIQSLDQIPKSFRARLALCDYFAPFCYAEEPLSRLRSITKACLNQTKDRNKLAHGEWHIQPGVKGRAHKMICRMRRHGTRIGKERGFTVAQINRMTKTYSALAEDFTRFAIDHHPEGTLQERLERFFRNLQHNQTA